MRVDVYAYMRIHVFYPFMCFVVVLTFEFLSCGFLFVVKKFYIVKFNCVVKILIKNASYIIFHISFLSIL